MTTFLLIRHGQAEPGGWDQPDSARNLTPRGRRDALEGFPALLRLGLRPTRVIASPFARAQQTATCLLQATLAGCPLEAWEGIVPEGAPEVAELWMRALATEAPGDAVLALVSHQPFLGDLVAHLTGEEQTVETASVTVLGFERGVFQFKAHHTAEDLRRRA